MKEYFKRIIESNSKESSKRLIAIWGMFLATIIVFICIYKESDLITILSLLLGFVLSLLGVATYQSVKNKQNENKN